MDLLVVDDHVELLDLVTRSFTQDGHRVTAARTAAEGERALGERPFDVIILDVGLPDRSGIELCRSARRHDISTPILILTAHASVQERVDGLDAGADDFMGKPFAIAELRARIRALGRRRGLPTGLVWTRGNVALDFPKRRASVSDQEVPLTAREWGILELLASAAGRVVSRTQILDSVWGGEDAGASLEVLVARIRRKLGERTVRTLRGEGYALGE